MGFLLLGIALLALKLMQWAPVSETSWWLILSPFLAAVLWWWWVDYSGITKRREMDKLDERRKERRKRNLDALGLKDTKRR